MEDSERQLGVFEDLLLPLDADTRYDVHFTDKRIAIIWRGPAEIINYQEKEPFAIAKQTDNLSVDKMLKLSKKSCFYTYDEITQVRLLLGKKPKFMILSEDCESRFLPDEQQGRQLSKLLPTVPKLKNKLSIIIRLDLSSEKACFLLCTCGSKNDLDSVFCQSCGRKIQGNQKSNPTPVITCVSCGGNSSNQASFCKKCGAPIKASVEQSE